MVASGDKVFGRYEVLRRLAVGGMGEIFLARQTGVVDRLVILKSLLPQLAEDAQALAQFLDEARILGSINHPNVCALYDVGEWSDMHFIAMEYINGVDVAQLLKFCEEHRKRLPPLTSAQIVREAAMGLDAAHTATDAAGNPLRVVHRDISPHNVMVRQDGLSKVVDFGVAVAENRLQKTETGLLKGKLGYMAPEQIKGAPVEPKADQFSLGVMLWELLTQRRLYVGENAAQVFMKILKESPPAPSSLVPDVPKELDEIVLRMTSMEPVNRFNRLADAGVAIRRALELHKAPDNGTQQLIRATVGPELQNRLKELAAAPRVEAPISRAASGDGSRGRIHAGTPSSGTPTSGSGPIALTPGGTPVPPSFCGTCGTPSQSGDAFCRACGANMGTGAIARVDVMATAARTGVVRRDDSSSNSGSNPGSNPFLLAPQTPSVPTRLPSSVLMPLSELDLQPIEPKTPQALKVPTAPESPEASSADGFPQGMIPPKSSTAIAPATSTNVTEAAVVAGLVEMLKQGQVKVADADARKSVLDIITDVAARTGAALEADPNTGRFTLRFSGEGSIVAAVDVGASNMRLSARAGHDALLRLAVAADPAAAEARVTQLVSIAETLVNNCAPGSTVVVDIAKEKGGNPATSRSASVAMRQGGSVIAHELLLPRRLVGRSVEISMLDAALGSVEKEGKAKQLMLLGDGGVGKTALLTTALAFAKDRGFLCGLARAARVAEPLALDVLRQLVRSVSLDLLAREQVQGPWDKAVDLCGLPEAYAARVKAIIDDNQDLGLADVVSTRRRAVLKSSILYFFEKLAEKAPIALFIDDIHKGDTPSFEILAEIGARLADKQVALIAAGRPVQGERLLPLAKRINLATLHPSELVAAASLMLGSPVVDPLAGVLVSRSLGNPLVLTLLVRHLLATRAIEPTPSGVRLLGDADRLGLPANPTALIHANHATLPPDAQSVLLAAAHIGQVFDVSQLEQITGGVRDIPGVLKGLEETGIFEALPATPSSPPQWAFASTVEQETIPARLDAMQARQLQQRVADALQRAIDGRFTVERGERLAHHLTLAEARQQAADVSTEVARRAAALGLFELAAEHHKRALSVEWRSLTVGGLVGLNEERAEKVLNTVAAATAAMIEVDAAAAVELAVPVLKSVPPLIAVQARVAALRQRGLALARTKRFSEAEACLDEALETLQGHYDGGLAAGLLIDLASVLEQRGDIDSALSQLQEGLKLLAGVTDGGVGQDRIFDGVLLLGRLGLRQRQFKAAETAFLRAIDEAHRQNRPGAEADARALLGAVAQGQGNLEGALDETELAITLAEKVGDPILEARLRQQRGRALVAMGRRGDAADALSRALACARRGQWDEGVSAMQQLLAVVGG